MKLLMQAPPSDTVRCQLDEEEKKRGKVAMKYNALSLTVYLGMTGCTGSGHPTMQSYNPFRGLHLICPKLGEGKKKMHSEDCLYGTALIQQIIKKRKFGCASRAL